MLAGLGAGLNRSGPLAAEARHKALAALSRFRLLVDHMKVKQTQVERQARRNFTMPLAVGKA